MGHLRLSLSGLIIGALVATATAIPTASAGPDQDQASTAVALRGLQVKVKRPPEAKKLVKVKITGPAGFRATITRTTTWSSAKPGIYRIKAKTIKLYDQQIVPTVVKRKVTIKANRAREVSRVAYAQPIFCARSGAEVSAWGESDQGRLGEDVEVDQNLPITIPKLYGATAVAGGLRTSYALCRDGSVWSWGYHAKGELGSKVSGDRPWPVQVFGLAEVTAIAARREGAIALKADGTVWAWGSGSYGQLGNGQAFTSTTSSKVPVQVALPAPATAIASAGYTSYALLNNGTVVAWGNGGVGQLGNATSADSSTPVAVLGLTSVTQIAASGSTGFALRSDDTVWAWGGGGEGQIGDGSMANRNVPAQVSLPAGTAVASIGASLAAGYAVTDAGSVWSWGSGRHGDLGFDNGGSLASTPHFNVTLSGVKTVVGAGYGGYALTADGTIWAWGDNGAGQVGVGAAPTGPSATEGVEVPTQIPGLSGVTAIGAGVVNGYAVR